MLPVNVARPNWMEIASAFIKSLEESPCTFILNVLYYTLLHNLNPVFMQEHFIHKSTNHDFGIRNTIYIPKVLTTRSGIKTQTIKP